MKEERTTDEKSLVEIDLDNKHSEAEQTVGLTASHAIDLLPGQTIAGRYIVMEELGRGGMGVVYKVNQFALSRHLALKTIHSAEIPDSIWRRFQQEAKATGLLHHPNLISVHDFGLLEDKHPYFVMDLIEGTTLAKHIEKHGPLSVKEALPLMIQVCFGLAHAHDVGIIHRDIKPSNIMLCKTESATASSTVKIVDFGIAKLHSDEPTQGLTRTGEIFGSPLYMSPEQCLGQPLDHRSDIYAFGCVFFETLTGLPPFQGSNALATMMKHQTEKPPTLKEITLGKEFPQEIEKMIARLLSKEPDQRYQSLKSVARDLSLLQQGVSAQDFSGAVPTAEKIQIGRNIPLINAVLMLIAGMTLVGVLAWTIRGNIDAEIRRKEIEAKDLLPPVHIPELVDLKTEPPFTSIETINGVRCRRFDFPKGFGKYRTLDSSSIVEINGPFYIPLSKEVSLMVKDLVTVTSPQFFSRFKSDDIAMLDIANNVNVSDTTFEHFSNLKTLKYLFANNIDLTNKVIDEFNRMPNLKAVYVDGTLMRQNGIVNYKYLRECSELGIGKNGPVDRVLQKLKGSTNLTVLSLEDSDLTDDQLKLVATLPNLWNLNIEHNRNLTNAGFKNLLGMKHLRLIRIAGTKITPDIIPQLKKLPSLKTIYVYPDNWKDKDRVRLKAEADINMDIDRNDWELYIGRKKHIEVDINDVKKIYQRNPIKPKQAL
ncbi:MAG: protein kinase [Candidatus Obscuribacterales bacterium]|nr:protein kinase [Candidatus Obscuribacterales bacterium]